MHESEATLSRVPAGTIVLMVGHRRARAALEDRGHLDRRTRVVSGAS